ncbi:helix-turn-helix domain-containing protein [Burkholderia anthina]|uniref:GlxA family transcriptional regulator n=1 Tax=Burkholderia anthina TaxID=179879 RepID=UPI001588A8C8
MPQSTCPARDIVVVGFEGVQSLDITGPMEVFAVANRHLPGHVAPYRLTLASQHGHDIVTHAGLRLAGPTALAALPARIDTLIVAGGSEAALRHAASDAGVLPWLRTRMADTRRVASICTGAFVLAAGGWLDGKRATTHWNQCSTLQALCPNVRIEPDAIYVSDPPFHTSAGVTAGIDLCLALVEADCGAPTALAVARELVLFMHRPGGQAQFSVGLDVHANATPQMRTLLAGIADDPTGDLGVATLAARLHMSERTFARNFVKETGLSPAQFVLAARVERAKALLERSDWPLEQIAQRAGFGSVDALQRAFAKRVGVSPRDYRARFGRSASADTRETPQA